MQNNITLAHRLLYYTYGILPIIVGLDKFFGLIVNWDKYLNDALPAYLNISPQSFLYGVGIIEIFAGLLVLCKPRIGGFVVAAWLLIIAIYLVSSGSHSSTESQLIVTYYDIAFRDLAMAIGAYVLVLLS